MRAPDDPSIERFDVDWTEPGPGPMAEWSSGWFWWRRYNTPAAVSITVGVAGDIVFPIYCSWADGEFYTMFFLRYDSVRDAIDLIHRDPDSQELNLDGDSEVGTDVEIDGEDFSPEVLFSQLAGFLDVVLLNLEQAKEIFVEIQEEDLWVPVDVGQGPVEFATASEID